MHVHVHVHVYVFCLSPTKILKGDRKNQTEGVSSDDFAKFMMSLQGSTNIVEDPGKSLSANTYVGMKGLLIGYIPVFD